MWFLRVDYLDILTNNKYKKQIKEIRVEGHTSSIWKNATREQSYINNMSLSQNRAKSVLAYSYNITSATNNKAFLENVFRANGMSFSKLIKENGEENIQASQRVEFRVITKAEEKIYEIINKLQ